MPYPTNASLPAAVKKRIKSPKKRRQWRRVWNSVFSRTHDESRAFASANAVAGRKEVDVKFNAKAGLFTMTEDEFVKLVHGEALAEPEVLDDEVAAEDEAEAAIASGTAVQPVVAGKAKRVTMYEGPDDNDLPDHVKVLPTGVRRNWVDQHHYALRDTQDNDMAADQADMYTSMSVRDVRKMMKTGGKEAKPGILDRIKAWLAQPVEARTPASNLTTFALKEGSDGRMRALLVYSNNFKDKEGEFFAASAHEEYVQAAEAGLAPYPELHLWHGGPDTRWGMTETVSYVDGFAVAGAVVDPGKEHVALKLKEMADRGELAVSFGYYGLRGPDKVHYLYRPFELSPLPVGSEANPWTTIDLATANKEYGMAWTDKKKAWFKEHFGMDDAAIAGAEKRFGEMASALKSVGVEWKEEGEQAPAPPDPAPVPPAPNPPTPPPPAPAAPVQGEQGFDPFGGLTTAIKSLTDKVGGLEKEVIALKEQSSRTVQERADDTVLARIAAAGTTGGHSPASSGSNVVGTKEEGAGSMDWLQGVIEHNFGAPVMAGAGGAAIAPVQNGEVK